MRALAWGVPVLVISGLSGTRAAPAPPAPAVRAAPAAVAAPGAGTLPATWDLDAAEPASARIDLSYVVAQCTVLHGIAVAEDAASVVIRLDLGGREGKDCTEPVRKHKTVRLRAPLGGRAVYDGGVSPALLVHSG